MTEYCDHAPRAGWLNLGKLKALDGEPPRGYSLITWHLCPRCGQLVTDDIDGWAVHTPPVSALYTPTDALFERARELRAKRGILIRMATDRRDVGKFRKLRNLKLLGTPTNC